VVFFFMLVSLNGEAPFEQSVIDGLIGIEIAGGNPPHAVERFLDQGLLCVESLVGIVVQQMIVTFDAVVDGFGGVKIEIPLEVISAEFREAGHGPGLAS
jgi:hypothetical protein